MRAECRTGVMARGANVSDATNAAVFSTIVTDGRFGMGVINTRQEIVHRKGLILVVEPDDLILGLLERWLGEAGYAIAVEGSHAPEALRDADPQLVIIDVPTPRSAEGTIDSVNRAYAGPILLLSARFTRGTGSSASVARQLGVRSVLPKPFTRDELLTAVADSIDGS